MRSVRAALQSVLQHRTSFLKCFFKIQNPHQDHVHAAQAAGGGAERGKNVVQPAWLESKQAQQCAELHPPHWHAHACTACTACKVKFTAQRDEATLAQTEPNAVRGQAASNGPMHNLIRTHRSDATFERSSPLSPVRSAISLASTSAARFCCKAHKRNQLLGDLACWHQLGLHIRRPVLLWGRTKESARKKG